MGELWFEGVESVKGVGSVEGDAGVEVLRC